MKTELTEDDMNDFLEFERFRKNAYKRIHETQSMMNAMEVSIRNEIKKCKDEMHEYRTNNAINGYLFSDKLIHIEGEITAYERCFALLRYIRYRGT